MSLDDHAPAVGILANPAAGRDIRRLVAQASVFPIAEKRNMITRLFSSLGLLGVATVYMMPDGNGIAHRIRHALETPPPAGQTWPRVVFLDMPIEDRAVDTLIAVEKMAELGVGGIIVLGGDGTHRLVASRAGDIPITALSTGTNNVFPAMREATIAGLAAGLVATGQIPAEASSTRNKVLRVDVNGVQSDMALIDLCTSTALWVGSRALWRADGLDQLFLSFAEADAIGLSSVGGLVRPVSRAAKGGVWLNLAEPETAPLVVAAPLAPGLVVDIGIEEVHDMRPGEAISLRATRGVVALDGEREIEFSPEDKLAVRLEWDGPLTLDIPRVMAYAAENGLLTRKAEISGHAKIANQQGD
jgi:predicted polyphosphate/ATP-dependent NAD kinase